MNMNKRIDSMDICVHYPFAMYFLEKNHQYTFPSWIHMISFIGICIVSFGIAVMIEKEIPEMLG